MGMTDAQRKLVAELKARYDNAEAEAEEKSKNAGHPILQIINKYYFQGQGYEQIICEAFALIDQLDEG